MKFFEEYPEYTISPPEPPCLLRLKEVKSVPNTRHTRALLDSALQGSIPSRKTLLDMDSDSSITSSIEADWVPYISSFISIEEAGIREAFENAKMDEANREITLIAKENYKRLYDSIKDLPDIYDEKDIRILLLPQLLEKKIEGQKDPAKKFHLEALRDRFYLWISERVSAEPNTNVLYYPYHYILAYQKGNEAHKSLLKKFFNDEARAVIEKRLSRRNLFTNRMEFFDYTQGNPSEWHSDAHQNVSIDH